MRGLWLATLVLLAGCGSKPLDVNVPRNVNFSGVWVVDFSDSDVVPDLRNARPDARRSSNNRRTNARNEALRVATGYGIAFVAHDFQILRADRLDIEQSRDSMGIKYTPGVYRDVSWGERQRGLYEVEAGWLDGALVVRSKAKDLYVVERFTQPAADVLEVSISIEAEGEAREFRRTFGRR